MKNKAIEIWKNTKFWEFIGYLGLALCLFGQVTIGWFYLTAQFAYLVANITGVIRDIALKLPRSNTVRDVTFTAITIALIVIRLCA